MKTKIDVVPEEIANCPIYQTMLLFQGKWNVQVLFELSRNPTMRFGQLKKSIPGISNTMLAATLKNLEEKELVSRIQWNEIPPHVEYSATDKAKALHRIFDEMAKWGEKYSGKQSRIEADFDRPPLK